MKTPSLPIQGYDIIGDLHGYALTCERLLQLLGYEPICGTYRHPSRKAIFVGDIINRGPRIPETLQLVRSMCESGSAFMVLGNHELEAVRIWSDDGRSLQPHLTEKQMRHSEATRQQIAADATKDWAGYLAWFRTLPLYLEWPLFRVVHACWDPLAIRSLNGKSTLSAIAPDGLSSATWNQIEAIDKLTQGLEMEVPFEGRLPEKVRTKWWVDPKTTLLRNAIFAKEIHLPNFSLIPLTATQQQAFCTYTLDERPIFFGHYSRDNHLLPYQSNVACLDLGLPRGGSLCAYRWSGEKQLMHEHFVTIPSAD